jgi:hypothetical protein
MITELLLGFLVMLVIANSFSPGRKSGPAAKLTVTSSSVRVPSQIRNSLTLPKWPGSPQAVEADRFRISDDITHWVGWQFANLFVAVDPKISCAVGFNTDNEVVFFIERKAITSAKRD